MADVFWPTQAEGARAEGGPFVAPLEESEASEDVSAVFAEIRQQYGFVPNLYRTLARFPPLLRSSWAKTKAVMGTGPLGALPKEAVAVAVSQANDCEYCVHIHSQMLRLLGVSDREIDAVLRLQWDRITFLDEREKALLGFVYKTNSSATRAAAEDVDSLRALGVSDREVLQALGIMDVYTSYNKLLVALRVPLDATARIHGARYPAY